MAYYDRIARKWHEVTGSHGGAFKKYVLNDVLISKIGDSAGLALLELGAGNGYFLPLLLRQCSGHRPARVVVTDQSTKLLDLARRHCVVPDAEYLTLDIRRRFPFESPTFDLILATMVFNEVPTPGLRQALKECHRVLRPRGRLLATVTHPQFIESLARREELRTSQDATWESYNEAGKKASLAGRTSEAEKMHVLALRIAEKFDPSDRRLGRSLNNLALAFMSEGKHDQAEALHKRALATREKAFGPEDPDVAPSLRNLASLYIDQGRYAEAEPLYRRSLAIREKVFGPDGAAVSSSLMGLGEMYKRQDKLDQAEPLLKRALAIDEKAMGATHPDTAVSLGLLADCYLQQYKYAQAEPLCARALAIQEKTLGPEEPKTAMAMCDLARAYHGLGRDAEAETLYGRALAVFEKALGPEHPDVATCLIYMGRLYDDTRKFDDAERPLRRALAIREKAFGPEHPKVARTLNTLAQLYMHGQLNQAEPLLRRAVAIAEKRLAPGDPDAALYRYNLAVVQRVMSQPPAAGSKEAAPVLRTPRAESFH
jgi:tetratricopeptide (TPR) repeat protein